MNAIATINRGLRVTITRTITRTIITAINAGAYGASIPYEPRRGGVAVGFIQTLGTESRRRRTPLRWKDNRILSGCTHRERSSEITPFVSARPLVVVERRVRGWPSGDGPPTVRKRILTMPRS